MVDQIDPARTEERIVMEEQRRHPKLARSLGPIPEAYFRRMEEEWAEANVVLVNSQWSKMALIEQGVPGAKIEIIPIPFEPIEAPLRKRSRGVLRVLWLGTLNLRKGLPYAIEAARLLASAPVQFTFAGPLEVSDSALELPANARYIGQVPRTLAKGMYSAQDVFLLPTLSDGFALTQVEAISHGLPVIATPCCGQVVEHGVSGFIVPPRDSRSIAEALEELLEPGRLEAMSAAAVARASAFSPSRILPDYLRVLRLDQRREPTA